MPQPNNDTELRAAILEKVPKTYCVDGCDGDGTGVGGYPPDDYFPVQCEYCFTFRFTIADDLMQLITSHNKKLELSARIDEQANHLMLDGSNVECQGCYNSIMNNSDRIAELEAQLSNLEGEKT